METENSHLENKKPNPKFRTQAEVSSLLTSMGSFCNRGIDTDIQSAITLSELPKGI